MAQAVSWALNKNLCLEKQKRAPGVFQVRVSWPEQRLKVTTHLDSFLHIENPECSSENLIESIKHMGKI